MGPARNGVRVLLASVLLVSLLSACGGIEEDLTLESTLEARGFSDVSVNTNGERGEGRLDVAASLPGGEESLARRVDEVGRVAWTTYDYRFDTLRVAMRQRGSTHRRTIQKAELEAANGPRPGHLGDRSIADDEERSGLILIGVVAGLFVVVGVGAAVVLAVIATRRRPAGSRLRTGGPTVGWPQSSPSTPLAPQPSVAPPTAPPPSPVPPPPRSLASAVQQTAPSRSTVVVTSGPASKSYKSRLDYVGAAAMSVMVVPACVIAPSAAGAQEKTSDKVYVLLLGLGLAAANLALVVGLVRQRLFVSPGEVQFRRWFRTRRWPWSEIRSFGCEQRSGAHGPYLLVIEDRTGSRTDVYPVRSFKAADVQSVAAELNHRLGVELQS